MSEIESIQGLLSLRTPYIVPSPPEPKVTSLADFYLQLFKQSTAQTSKRPPAYQEPWPMRPIHNPYQPAEPTMSSPGSIASEDSGIGAECVSDEEECRKISCGICTKTYTTISGLRKHEEQHRYFGLKQYSCDSCPKSYTSIGALKMHIKTHTLPCKCHICGKAFSRPWLLQGHIRTHTGEKPFQCGHCHRSFADRSNLRAHQQTHERIKKYACKTCNKTFSRMSLLNKHKENVCMVERNK